MNANVAAQAAHDARVSQDGVAREPLLEARSIIKRYGRVTALSGADFTVYPNEVVALVGDNGAGKSTLVKILAGVVSPDAGALRIEGRDVVLSSPLEARKQGIETVFQDLALAADLNPAANLFLGREVMRKGLLGWLGFLDKAAMRQRTESTFNELSVPIRDASVPVAALSGGQRQGVAVARAVVWASKVVIMDEPTAALGVVQTRRVLDLIRTVRARGLSVVLISHNMTDVFSVADRVEVMRLGRRVAAFETASCTRADVVSAMTGIREVGE